MKRLACLLLAILTLSGVALGDDFYGPVYPVNESGEAVVNDVAAPDGPLPDDNNRVFYEIFVGSFSDSDGDGVGDLRGVINRMDYLNDGDPFSGVSLGVEGIWLTPIFASPSYHKYDVDDFYAVDPAFGTEEDLKKLVSVCHERGVKLILDLPINHTSTRNRWFQNFLNAHITHNPANPWYNFYSWAQAGDALPAGRHFAGAPGAGVLYEANFSDSMPEPDFDQPRVRQALLDVALYYLDLGVDGFRFDAAKYIYLGDNEKSARFWEWYMGELKNAKDGLYTVAEVWDGDGVIDRYIPMTDCFNFTASQAEGLIAETAKAGDVNRFTAYVERYQAHLKALREDAHAALFVSNHDMDRAAGYLTVASGYMKMAANLYLLSPGSPFIYYGEEIGLRGSRGGSSTDANRRLAMLWGDGDAVADPEGATYPAKNQTPYSVKDLARVSASLLNHYKKLIMVRKANPEIARGEYTALRLEGTKVGGFVCEWNGGAAAVIHNTTGGVQTVDLSGACGRTFAAVAASIGEEGEAVLEGTLLTLPPQTSAVLR